MKDFNEFKQSLTRETLNELSNRAVDYTNDFIDKNVAEDNVQARFVMAQRLYAESLTIDLLEMYHKWVNESDNT
jgi:hypothetical protein